ncbi:GNAT family N-acetyltransferase [Kitasatospora sp. NPDC059648]|uniref:GNAT family N-acetyltransferase n=1 Tax=Kitasatospora sp. NPDC059648 TaxID=3346894 RepID=UPI0036A551F7
MGNAPRVLETPAQAEAAIERLRSHGADPRFGVWAAERKDTGVIAGTAMLVPIPNGGGEVEVGWYFHPDSRGNGFASEAVQDTVAKGFTDGWPRSTRWSGPTASPLSPSAVDSGWPS